MTAHPSQSQSKELKREPDETRRRELERFSERNPKRSLPTSSVVVAPAGAGESDPTEKS
jgi:hypothetical protein